jgi:hypothetical protein
MSCPECDGDGTGQCYECTSGIVECPNCNGDGEIECCCSCGHSHYVRCGSCNGDGSWRCTACDGTPLVCSYCAGADSD